MDLNFLPSIVARDEGCQYPAAERALRELYVAWFGHPQWSYASRKLPPLNVPHISDPAGLIRSLHSRTTAGAGAQRGR